MVAKANAVLALTFLSLTVKLSFASFIVESVTSCCKCTSVETMICCVEILMRYLLLMLCLGIMV